MDSEISVLNDSISSKNSRIFKKIIKDKNTAIVETVIKDKQTGKVCIKGEATVMNIDKIK